MQTLLLFSHTFWQDSKVNKELLASLKDEKSVFIHFLDEVYKDSKIDIQKEISLLENTQKIIIQFPIFWYGATTFLKDYQDRVLTTLYYSQNFNILQGKRVKIVATAGGDIQKWKELGGIDRALFPIEQSFRTLGAKVENALVFYDANIHNISIKDYLDFVKG